MTRRTSRAPGSSAGRGRRALLLGACALLLGSCGDGTGWVLVHVKVADEAVPLQPEAELESLLLTATPDGCEGQSLRLPAEEALQLQLPGELVVELTDACPSERVTLLVEGLAHGAVVARGGPLEVEVREEGAEVTLPLARLCADADGDGYGEGAGCFGPDCDDSANDAHPGATEVCNGRDDDCDGAGDLPDGDGDGVQSCAGDCADGLPGVFPGAEERCDGVDEDCDGVVDDTCVLVGNGAFSQGLSGWTEVLVDTEGAVLPGMGIFAPAEVVEEVARVVTLAPGDYTGLMLCSDPFALLAGASMTARARVAAAHPGAPTAAWAVLRLVDEAYGTLSVGAPLEAPPADGTWAFVTASHLTDVDVRARLCLLFRSIRDADRGGPTAAGTALFWDEASVTLE